MKLWRQRQAQAKGKRRDGISHGIGSASLGDLTLTDSGTANPSSLGLPPSDSIGSNRTGLIASSSSRLGFPSLGSQGNLSPLKAARTRAISAPKLRPKTWVSNLIAAAANNGGDGPSSSLETASQADARADALSRPRPLPVSDLVLSRGSTDGDRIGAKEALHRAQAEAEAGSDAALDLGRPASTSGRSALSSMNQSQFSRSAPSLPLSNTVLRYQDHKDLEILPPLAPAIDAFPIDRDPASPLVIRNLDEAPRGAWTPAMEPPATAKLATQSRLRNPWGSRSEEDDLVDAAVAESRSNQQLAVEEEAVLSMLDSMSNQSMSGQDIGSRESSSNLTRSRTLSRRVVPAPLAPEDSPASQYSSDFLSPAPTEASRFPQAPSGSSNVALRSVREAVQERERLDRDASISTSAASASTAPAAAGWLARGSALRKKASSYFSAVGWDSSDKNADTADQEASRDKAADNKGGCNDGADVDVSALKAISPAATEDAAEGEQQKPRPWSCQERNDASKLIGESSVLTTPGSDGFAQTIQPTLQPSAQARRPSMHDRDSEYSSSSSVEGGLYARQANASGQLLSPASPLDGSPISSSANATSLWSRPAYMPDTPNTSHDPRSPNQNSSLYRWDSNKQDPSKIEQPRTAARPGYRLDTGGNYSGSSVFLPPRFRRQTTDWTDATSFASGSDEDPRKDEPGLTLVRSEAGINAGSSRASSHSRNSNTSSRDNTVAAIGEDVPAAISGIEGNSLSKGISDAGSRAARRFGTLRSNSSSIDCNSVPTEVAAPMLASDMAPSVASRQSRQSARAVPRSACEPAPLSPVPSSPTKAKDLIRFFETAGTATPTGSPKLASPSPNTARVSLRSAKKAFGESSNELYALQVTPKRPVFPLGSSNSNPNTATHRDSPFATSVDSPLAAKLRAGGVAPRHSRLRSRVGGLVTAGGGGAGGLDGDDPNGGGGGSDEENLAPSLDAPPVRISTMAQRRFSGSSTTGRTPIASRPSMASVLAGPAERSTHGRSGSTPTPLEASSMAAGTLPERKYAVAALNNRDAAEQHGRNASGSAANITTATTSNDNNTTTTKMAESSAAATGVAGGSAKKGGAAGGGFPFRNSVRNIVNAFSGRGFVEEPGPSRSMDRRKPLKKAVSTGWDHVKEPWEAQQSEVEVGFDAAAEKKGQDDQEETTSVASRLTIGTIASFKHRVETGDLPASAATAVELSGEPSSSQPVRSGVLYYFNVHRREPHWQRVQVVLLPTAIAMSWIPTGGGRENVVLDLRACREVHSVPSPDHPSSLSDVGASRARQQGLGRLSPFQLIFDDGVERLAAESATERVKWVDSVWDVTGVSAKSPADLSEPKTRLPMAEVGKPPWSPSSSPSKRDAAVRLASRMAAGEPRSRTRTEDTAVHPNTFVAGQTEDLTLSPRQAMPGNRSINTVEAIDRIGSIWQSELSSDHETREGHPSIAEALATGPPVPPKDPTLVSSKSSNLPSATEATAEAASDVVSAAAAVPGSMTAAKLARRHKVRSWRRKDGEGDSPVGGVQELAPAKSPNVVTSPEHAVHSQPASFADEDKSETRTLADSRSSPRKPMEMAVEAGEGLSRSRSVAPTTVQRPPHDADECRNDDDAAASSRAVALHGPPETKSEAGVENGVEIAARPRMERERQGQEGNPSPAGTSPDLDGYESAHSHSSQIDEFGPRTPVSEAVFNWSIHKRDDGEIRPSDSASQRPLRSEFGTIRSQYSVDSRRREPSAASAAESAELSATAGAPLTKAAIAAAGLVDGRTPAQKIRDSVLASDATEAVTRIALTQNEELIDARLRGPSEAPVQAQRLGTVIEETQSQAQSTRESAQATVPAPHPPKARDGSEVYEVIASSQVGRESIKSPAAGSRISQRTASSMNSQDVYRLLEHLEDQQRTHMEREKLMEDQIRGFQDVIAGLQSKSAGGSIRSRRSHRSASGESRSTSRSVRDSELAAMQDKLDKVLDLMANVVGLDQAQRTFDGSGERESHVQRNGGRGSLTSAELARFEAMLQKGSHPGSTSEGASALAGTLRTRSIVREAVLTRNPSLTHEWDRLPAELKGAELMRTMGERAKHGRDGRHEAIAHDLSDGRARQGSAPPRAEHCADQLTPRGLDLDTPRLGEHLGRAPSRASMAGSSVSMTELETVASRVPPRSWVSANGIPSPPPNSEWDVGSVRGAATPARFAASRNWTPPAASAAAAANPRTPAQNVRMHGDPTVGFTMPTPRPVLGPAEPNAGSVDMEAEVRRVRARQQIATGLESAQPGGWYTPKVVEGAADTFEMGDKANTPQQAPRVALQQRGPSEPETPAAGRRIQPGPSARDPGKARIGEPRTPNGLGLSLSRKADSGTFDGPRSSVGPALAAAAASERQQPAPSDERKLNASALANPELATILEALKQSEAARENQVRQQAELARYMNELHTWLEKDVAERSKEFRILATGVTQLHDEFLASKQGRPLALPTGQPSSAAPAQASTYPGAPALSREPSGQTTPGGEGGQPSGFESMPVPTVTAGDAPLQFSGPRIGPNPYADATATGAAAAAAAPPAPLRPGLPTTEPTKPANSGIGASIPFGNGGRWTNLETPNLDNGFTTPPRAKRPQTRTWHANAPTGPRKPGESWYLADERGVEKPAKTDKAKRPSPLKSSGSYDAGNANAKGNKAAKLVAAANGALLVRAALKEWEKFKAQQRAEGKPEDPVPVGATGDPELDQQIPLPEPVSHRLQQAVEAGHQDDVATVVREAAQAGLGTQAIIKLTEHVERMQGADGRSTGDDDHDDNDAPLDGDTLAPSEAADRSVGMLTPSPHKTRFADVADEISVQTTSNVSEDFRTDSVAGGASTGALALAVEEILKHLLERKEDEKRKQAESAAAKARKEAEKRTKEETQLRTLTQQKEAEKAELVELILNRLNTEKARQEAEMAKKQQEMDPKSAIESLVTMLNSQRESERASQISADQAIKEMASSLLRTTTEQNGKLVEAVNSAAREMLRHNVEAHADELKRTLTKEVAVMFEDVGKIREAKRALEHEIADLFAIKSRHLGFDAHNAAMPMPMSMPMPLSIPPAQIGPYHPPLGPAAAPQAQPAQPWIPPHAITMPVGPNPPPAPDAAPNAAVEAPAARTAAPPDEKVKRKAARKAAKALGLPAPAPAPAPDAAPAAAPPAAPAAVPPAVAAAAPSFVPAFLGGGRDILSPFSVNFGPRLPK